MKLLFLTTSLIGLAMAAPAIEWVEKREAYYGVCSSLNQTCTGQGLIQPCGPQFHVSPQAFTRSFGFGSQMHADNHASAQEISLVAWFKPP